MLILPVSNTNAGIQVFMESKNLQKAKMHLSNKILKQSNMNLFLTN